MFQQNRNHVTICKKKTIFRGSPKDFDQLTAEEVITAGDREDFFG
jgi:hypothetical protein